MTSEISEDGQEILIRIDADSIMTAAKGVLIFLFGVATGMGIFGLVAILEKIYNFS
ncbi:MAG: hypothetical protein WC451_02700 [Patescibacteria group bacterium]